MKDDNGGDPYHHTPQSNDPARDWPDHVEPDFNKFLAQCRRDETKDFWKAARFMGVLLGLVALVGWLLFVR